MVPIEEALRIILPLERTKPLMTPPLIPVQGRQRLIIVGIVLINDHPAVSRDLRLSKVVAPLQGPGIRILGHAIVSVGHGEDNGVVESLTVREGGEVLWVGFDARLAEGLDEDDAAACGGVLTYKCRVGVQGLAEVSRL